MAGCLLEFCTVCFSLCLSVRSARAPSALPAENRKSSFNKHWLTDERSENITCIFLCVCVCVLPYSEKLPNLKLTPTSVKRHQQLTRTHKRLFLKATIQFWQILPQLCSAVSSNNCLLIWNCVCVYLKTVSGWAYMDDMSVCIIHPLWPAC